MAVSFTCGTSLSTDGPGLSAFIRFMVELPVSGSSAIINTSTPIPPIQCVKLLQNRPELLMASTSVRILAPVVVKPDIVSNSASIYDGMSPVSTNGTAPAALRTIQLSATLTKPSLVYSLGCSSFLLHNMNPRIRHAIAVIR